MAVVANFARNGDITTPSSSSLSSSNNSNGSTTRIVVDGEHVLSYLKSNLLNVQELSCSQVLTDDDVDNLHGLLRENHTQKMQLRSLQLPKNNLTSSCARALAHIVRSTPTLRVLDLSDNDINPEGLSVLMDEALTLPGCRLSVLNLSNNKLGGKKGAAVIAKLLRENISIQTLVLAHNSLGSRMQFIKDISCSLQHSHIRHLDLSKNKLGDRGAASLAHVLHYDGLLESLDLSNNKIRYNGAYHLANAFVQHKNKTLLKLDLSDNMIESVGAEFLGTVLQFSHTMQELSLSRNNIGDEGVKAIALGIKRNRESALQRLDLSWNGIKDEGAGLLADMLMENSVLAYLNLRCNFICDKGIHSLAHALPFPLALQELDLTGNQMRDPSPLVDALCHHETKVDRVHCDQNHLSEEGEERLRAAFTFRINKQGWLGSLLRDIRNKKQVSCDLFSKKHSDEEIIAISRQLSKYKRIVTTAMFAGPMVSARGITSLAGQVLATNTCNLMRLSVMNSPLRDAGAAALAQALASNNTLRFISLTDCQITGDGAHLLSNALRKNSALTRLCLVKNKIGDMGFGEICRAILEPSHPSLISLNVAENEITDQGLSTISSIARLEELYLDGNNLTDYGALFLAKAVYGYKSLGCLSLTRTHLSRKGIKTLEMWLPTPRVLVHDGLDGAGNKK